jgi:hypothetical protein
MRQQKMRLEVLGEVLVRLGVVVVGTVWVFD